MMKKAFVYGVSVAGENFTDRVNETRRLKMDFENGQNVILLSPRRMGKTSLVQKVMHEVDKEKVKVIYLDIYDCKSDIDFYRKFATEVLRSTANKADLLLENARQFLSSLVPQISFSPSPDSNMSLSLGLNIKTLDKPEEVLNLAERIAEKAGTHIVVCIDEFQQIGEMPDSISLQKRMRSVWQLQQHVTYCLFGSKKHMLHRLFKDKRMPFYQFGDTIELDVIPTEDWVSFICHKFEERNIAITQDQAARICTSVRNYSSYVQQLAWNVMLFSETAVTDEVIDAAIEETIRQNSALYQEQIKDLSSFQMNFLRAICHGVHSGFTSKDILERFHLGTKSNISRLHTSLIEKELIESKDSQIFIMDPVFEIWFKRECMNM